MKQLGSVRMKRNGVPDTMENRLGTNAHLPIVFLYEEQV